jgi:hypothetical protein
MCTLSISSSTLVIPKTSMASARASKRKRVEAEEKKEEKKAAKTLYESFRDLRIPLFFPDCWREEECVLLVRQTLRNPDGKDVKRVREAFLKSLEPKFKVAVQNRLQDAARIIEWLDRTSEPDYDWSARSADETTIMEITTAAIPKLGERGRDSWANLGLYIYDIIKFLAPYDT